MLIDKLVKQVQSLNLNQTGKTVLTETPSGAYVVTLLIAAITGAKVFAYSRTTANGTVDDIFQSHKSISMTINTAGIIAEYLWRTLDSSKG